MGWVFNNQGLKEMGPPMGKEDVFDGRVKQIRGQANQAIGNASGDKRQRLKGKLQVATGKVQEAIGKNRVGKPGGK